MDRSRIVSISKTLFLSCVALSSCGRSEGYKQSDSPSDSNSPTASNGKNETWNSYAIATSALLPKCEPAKVGALAYVRDEKKFYTCEATGWQVEDILPKETNSIVGRWKFHVDSYQGEPNLSDEDADIFTKIGDISIIKFQNGTAFFSFSGVKSEYLPNIDEFDGTEFSFSDFITNTKTEFSAIYKLDTYSNMRLRIKINASAAVPTFSAVVDVDGNFSDNIDKSFTLTAVSP